MYKPMNRHLAGLRVFLTGAYFSYIALFRWFRPAQYVASKIVMPLAQILFFAFLGMYTSGTRDPSYYVVGNAIQLAAISGIYGVTMSVGGERWSGTLGYLFGSPANRMLIFIGRAFMHIIDGMLGVVLGLVWGTLLLGVDLSRTDLGALALTILITTVSTSGMGLLMGCIGLISRNVMFINNTVYFSLLALSGANVPVESLPGWVQRVSCMMPLTRGIAATRRLVDGQALGDVVGLLGGELLVGAIYIAVGYGLFRQFEFAAKKRGTLEVM